MTSQSLFQKKPLTVAVAVVLGIATIGMAGCNSSSDDTAQTQSDDNAQIAQIKSIEFTDTPAPSDPSEAVRSITTSDAVVTYTDGTTKSFPLSYNLLYKNIDAIGDHPAAQLFDNEGNPLMDANGAPVIAETPDANSLLTVDGNTYLVTHYEYDWIVSNGERAPSRMPMSMTLTDIAQGDDGKLTAVEQRPIDFADVDGLWIPCFGSQTPWNTHLGSEEDYDMYFIDAESDNQEYGSRTSSGLAAMSELYLGGADANPYNYGFLPEVTVAADGSTSVVKHYAMGRGTWEAALVMPDQRTAYYGDDGTNVALFMFVADEAADLSAGSLYAAKWNQISGLNGGTANLTWVKLGSANNDEIRAIIDAGTTFWEIFDITTPEKTPAWAEEGYRAIRAGQSATEYVRLKDGMEKAAAFLESRRYAAYLGATTEFNKMEGVAKNAADKILYVAMSYIDRGMLADETGPVDDIQIAKINAGGTYEVAMTGGQKDTAGDVINSEWVGTTMELPVDLMGVDIAADSLGNIADPDKVANPDNVYFAEKMRTLFIGEDSGTHVNNFVWAYNVDTRKLSRILSLPSGAEATGLSVVENLNGHAYIMSNTQHHGEWLRSMPDGEKTLRINAAAEEYGSELEYKLQANVGYIGGIPGL